MQIKKNNKKMKNVNVKNGNKLTVPLSPQQFCNYKSVLYLVIVNSLSGYTSCYYNEKFQAHELKSECG